MWEAGGSRSAPAASLMLGCGHVGGGDVDGEGLGEVDVWREPPQVVVDVVAELVGEIKEGDGLF